MTDGPGAPDARHGARVPAIGGERTVPEPDAVARGYLRLALRLDLHDPGILDSYTGPADLKAAVDIEQPRSLGRLRDDAADLLERVEGEVDDPARRAWLAGQVAAMGARLEVLDGASIPYLEQVRRSFGIDPRPRGAATFDEAASELERLLPGAGPLPERLEAWDERITIPGDRVAEAVDLVVGALRGRAADRFGVPAGERVRVGLVRDQPWSGYHWFDGGGRSRVDLNVDLPIRAPALVRTLAHETYAGHHLEAVTKEAELVERRHWLEQTAAVLLTPAAVVSEGLADLGPDLLLPDAEQIELLAELMERTAVPAAGGSVPIREAAGLAAAISRQRERLREVAVDAALARWVDGRDHDATLELLVRLGRLSRERAEASLRFIEDPRWRTYVHVYHEGRPLLERWVRAAPDGDPVGRVRRLLVEPLTPAGIAADLAGAGGAR
jgi:hypothetical protein